MKFKRGDLVEAVCCWYEEGGESKTEMLLAIVIEAEPSDIGWIKVWIPARNGMMFTDAILLKGLEAL